jgi:hypothetical protein
MWIELKIKDYEKVFNRIFNPESLFGYSAVLYDEALTKSKNYGTTWQEEMEKQGNYFDFLVDYLESEGLTPNDV